MDRSPQQDELDVTMRFLRALKGWTQRELAKHSGRGVSQIEAQGSWPRPAALRDLAKALEVTTEELTGQEPLRLRYRSDVIEAVRDLTASESMVIPNSMRTKLLNALDAGTMNPIRWYLDLCTDRFVEHVQKDPIYQESDFVPYVRGSVARKRLDWADRQRVHGLMDRGAVASHVVDGTRYLWGYELNRLLAEEKHRFFQACDLYYRHWRKRLPDGNAAAKRFFSRIYWVYADGREADDWKTVGANGAASSLPDDFILAAHSAIGPVDPREVLSSETQQWLKEKWDAMINEGKPLTPRD